jgi:sugar lactone lactonase YvrE
LLLALAANLLAVVPPAAAQTITTLASNVPVSGALGVDPQGDIFFESYQPLTSGAWIYEIRHGESTAAPLGGGLGPPRAVAADAAGNLFVVENNAVREYLTADRFTTSKVVVSGLVQPGPIALDAAGNLFVVDGAAVKEAAAPNYASVNRTVTGAFSVPSGLALDRDGNLFIADAASNTIFEATAASGFGTVTAVTKGFGQLDGIAIDAAGNLFAADSGANIVYEVPVASGYTQMDPIGGTIPLPQTVTVDANGNLFIGAQYDTLYEFPAASGYRTISQIQGNFRYIGGLATDPAGNVLVADPDNGTVASLSAASTYRTAADLVSSLSFNTPFSLSFDAAGNLFVADEFDNSIKELPAATGYASFTRLPVAITQPTGMALDAAGNIYCLVSGYELVEIPAAGGYTTVTSLATGLYMATQVAVDGKGDVFVTDSGNGLVKEVLPDGTVRAIGGPLPGLLQALAIDGGGNLYVQTFDEPSVWTIPAAQDYATSHPLGSFYQDPNGIAVDGAGNVLVSDGQAQTITQISSAPPTLFAAVLPGARAVVTGTPATTFASLINSGPTALDNCSVSLPPSNSATEGLTLQYQATDPASNVPVGTPDTPFSLVAQGGTQTLLLTFGDADAIVDPIQTLNFGCRDGAVLTGAPIEPGVNTMGLLIEPGQGPDIIALSATVSGDGTVHMSAPGVAAFAVASIDVGAAGSMIVSAGTGGTVLPLTATVCQTDPASGQCLAPPAATLSVNFSAGAAPTFSAFLSATGPIAFDPAASRVYFRFSQTVESFPVTVLQTIGATSVAVEAEQR